MGVSGTGSVAAEQLACRGVGEITFIDFDKLQERNLNRILNTTQVDIEAYKVEIFASAIRRYRPDCDVIPLASSISEREAVYKASEADALFST